jgi:hypothetical protein
MKFVKLQNGNVNITDDSGLIQYTFTDNFVRINPIGLNETVQISQYGYPILTFIIADVSGTQILPAAEIPFAGTTASDLIDILSADFFLINSGGGGVIPNPLNVNVVSPVPLPVSGTIISEFPLGSLDAFARQRVSNPATIFDVKLTNDNRPLIFDDQQISGVGTSSIYSINTSSVTLSVSNLTAGRRVRQTFRRFNYQSGKSQLIILTGVLGVPTSGNSKKIGYFDDDNGLFFDSTGATVGVNVRTFTTGVAVNTRIAQSSWNIDRLDGTGASSITLDFSKTQIFFFDFEWLGVGTVRFGFFVDGVPIYCHAFQHANVLTDVYMSTPNLPVRYEIENDGTGAADSIKQICSTIISEGGYNNTGYPLSIDRDAVLLTGNNINFHPLFAMRLKANFLGSTVNFSDFSIICTSNASYRYRWLINPTVSGVPFTFNSLPNSSIEYDNTKTNTTTITNGTIINSGVGSQGTQGGQTKGSLNREFALGATIDGIRQVLVLAVAKVTGSNESFYSAVNLNDQK